MNLSHQYHNNLQVKGHALVCAEMSQQWIL